MYLDRWLCTGPQTADERMTGYPASLVTVEMRIRKHIPSVSVDTGKHRRECAELKPLWVAGEVQVHHGKEFSDSSRS